MSTVTSGPGDSGSSATQSGWRISPMGFCPELARPLGAPALILQEAGKTWPQGRKGQSESPRLKTVSGDRTQSPVVGRLRCCTSVTAAVAAGHPTVS